MEPACVRTCARWPDAVRAVWGAESGGEGREEGTEKWLGRSEGGAVCGRVPQSPACPAPSPPPAPYLAIVTSENSPASPPPSEARMTAQPSSDPFSPHSPPILPLSPTHSHAPPNAVERAHLRSRLCRAVSRARTPARASTPALPISIPLRREESGSEGGRQTSLSCPLPLPMRKSADENGGRRSK